MALLKPSAEETEDVRVWSRFRGQGDSGASRVSNGDTDRTFSLALGSGLGVGEKRAGRGSKRGRLGKGNRGSLTACFWRTKRQIQNSDVGNHALENSLSQPCLHCFSLSGPDILRCFWALGDTLKVKGGSAGRVGFGQLCLGDHRCVALVNLTYNQC